FGIRALEDETHSWTRPVRCELTIFGRDKSIEEHGFNSCVIVEILYVAKLRNRTADVHMQRGRAVRGDRTSEACRDSGSFEEAGESLPPRCVQLNDIHGSRFQHVAEIQGIISIFAGGNLHSVRSAITHSSQSIQIIGAHRLFKPSDLELIYLLGEGY